MAKDSSFDVVSDYDTAEMTNAVDQTQRELATRFDFKGTAAKLEFGDSKTSVQIEGDSQSQTIQLPSSLAKGVYFANFNGAEVNNNQTLIVE